MVQQQRLISRRRLLRWAAGVGANGVVCRVWADAAPPSRHTRVIPSTGERVPIIGMGSWITFNVAGDKRALATRVEVLRRFFAHGGGVIDSSPMYGSSEQVIGYCLERLHRPRSAFTATKVWTSGRGSGIDQMEHSERLWRLSGSKGFDLLQIHNLVDWETHLETLVAWKTEGRVRYIGITTSHGRRHRALEGALDTGQFDFVQLTYNILDRQAEQRLLPMARERNIAVLANRPFQRAALFRYTRDRRLPDWASEIDCRNWPQFLLKFVVSHAAVTCAIPATSKPEHMDENMEAGVGALPDAAMRRRMIAHFESL